ncbi:uncharacterized protein LOC135388046 isoform X2 [Ornithodoros turicata]|uniref:uncharacterized protein LOC135388046 isoform X2 n=1 Tax=Ornithodoros turicata TaxID=34597 RepID=UPI0031386E4F
MVEASAEALGPAVDLHAVLVRRGVLSHGALLSRVGKSQAAKRSLNAWQYGFFFSTWKIGLLIGSIISERVTAYVSPKAGYLTGQVGLFIFTVAFGSFFWIQDGPTLLGLSITSAIFGGTVASMYTVSLYSMITSRFHDDAGLLIASMEALWGIGSMAGAVTGGALIDLWEYPLPFYVMGTLVLISFPFMLRMEPRQECTAPQLLAEAAQQQDVRYYRLLWDLPFLSDMVTVTLAWGILSFNEPTLEPFLEQFKLNSTQVGTVFTVQSVCYAASALVAGALAKYKYERATIFLATGLGCLAYLVAGPAPFINTEPNLALVYLAQVFMGCAMSGQFVCGYMHALRSIIKRGYPDNVRTSSLVSSAVFFCMIVGAVATSPLAGYLAETFGYRNASLLMFAVLLLWTLVTGFQWLRSFCTASDVIHL